jgi:hypothetical protein
MQRTVVSDALGIVKTSLPSSTYAAPLALRQGGADSKSSRLQCNATCLGVLQVLKLLLSSAAYVQCYAGAQALLVTYLRQIQVRQVCQCTNPAEHRIIGNVMVIGGSIVQPQPLQLLQ